MKQEWPDTESLTREGSFAFLDESNNDTVTDEKIVDVKPIVEYFVKKELQQQDKDFTIATNITDSIHSEEINQTGCDDEETYFNSKSKQQKGNDACLLLSVFKHPRI